MYKIKSGKDEIVYLLTKVIEKYEQQTGHEIIQNTNRKNYEVIGIVLSDISNQLPQVWQTYGTDSYEIETNINNQTYPYRKYDITGGQIKDALNGAVSNPRPFLIDACYIFLYGVGRKIFEQNPLDENLLIPNPAAHTSPISSTTIDTTATKVTTAMHSKLAVKVLCAIVTVLVGIIILLLLNQSKIKGNWYSIKADMNILPYKPNQAEIDSLEGIWLCYTGSPQARISDPTRYHKVVSNLIEIQYKNGYFTYNRYGASFNHIGYVQFESAGIISVYSRIKSTVSKTESPRHSLINLNSGKDYLTAISASWNFDIGDKNKIIGIREIYIKVGKGGKLDEVINAIENASCKCKIIRWQQSDTVTQSFYLKNELLDSIPYTDIKSLINESSILPSVPNDKLLIYTDTALKAQ